MAICRLCPEQTWDVVGAMTASRDEERNDDDGVCTGKQVECGPDRWVLFEKTDLHALKDCAFRNRFCAIVRRCPALRGRSPRPVSDEEHTRRSRVNVMT